MLPSIAPFVLSPQSVGIMASARVETARDGVRDGAGRNRRIATGLKTGRPMLGELDVTRVLREFTTNYTFQRDVPSVSSFSGIVTGSFGWSAGQRLR